MTVGTIHERMTVTEWGLLLTLSALWGGSFYFTEIALATLPPFTVVWLRVGIAALALLNACRVMGISLADRRSDWGAYALMGALNNAIPFSLIVWGQTEIASGLAAILNAMTPVFTVIFAHFLTKDEKLTPSKLVGVIGGFAGVAIMIGWDALSGLGLAVMAQCAVLAAAVSYAFAGIFGRRFRRQPPLRTACGQLVASTFLMAPFVLLFDQPWTLPIPGGGAIAAVVGLALISTAPAYWLYFRILATAGASNLLLVTFLMPAIAVWLGFVFLNEALAVSHLVGIVLIAIAMATVDGRLLLALRRPMKMAKCQPNR